MKQRRFIALLAMVLVLVLCVGMLAACNKCADGHTDENKDGKCDECGGKVYLPTVCEHTDANFDGKCDKCKEAIEGAIPLYENGKMNFKFVLPANATSDTAMKLNSLINQLKTYGIVAEKRDDALSAEVEYEIFFGIPLNRDDKYKLDGHDYGMKGYAVAGSLYR